MKIVLLFWAAAAMMLIVGCQPQQSTGSCHVMGKVSDSLMEGQRIVIEPFDMSKTSVQADTLVVKDGQFETTLDSVLLYKVLPADGRLYSVLQPLIIVGEPGEVWIRLGMDSHAGGTLQNDTLDRWKVITEAHSRTYNQIRSLASKSAQSGDTVQAAFLNKQADSLQVAYSASTRRMAEGVGGGLLYDFLSRFFK